MTTRLTKYPSVVIIIREERNPTQYLRHSGMHSGCLLSPVRLFDQAMAFVVVRCASTRDAPAPARAPVGSPTPVRRRPYIVAGIAGRALGLKAKAWSRVSNISRDAEMMPMYPVPPHSPRSAPRLSHSSGSDRVIHRSVTVSESEWCVACGRG